jgi:hypothetical protein
MKKNETSIYATIWMNLESMLSEKVNHIKFTYLYAMSRTGKATEIK